MFILLHKHYLVKWFKKGEGWSKISKKKLSTWFMDDPLKTVDQLQGSNLWQNICSELFKDYRWQNRDRAYVFITT